MLALHSRYIVSLFLYLSKIYYQLSIVYTMDSEYWPWWIDWLAKGMIGCQRLLHIFLDLTMTILSLTWIASTIIFCLWLLFVIGHFTSWTLKMTSSFFQVKWKNNVFLHEDQEDKSLYGATIDVIQGESSNTVCRLWWSLHGLKQSHRAWSSKFNIVIKEFDKICDDAGHSMF